MIQNLALPNLNYNTIDSQPKLSPTQTQTPSSNLVSGGDDTVDGRNPALVDMVKIPLFTGFYTSQVVVWDFFHQQYPHLAI